MLPSDNEICTLTEPSVQAMSAALIDAIDKNCSLSDDEFNAKRWQQFQVVSKLYTWEKISQKLEIMYQNVIREKSRQNAVPIGNRVDAYLKGHCDSPTKGDFQASGVLFILSCCFSLIMWTILDVIDGRRSIRKVLSCHTGLSSDANKFVSYADKTK